MMLADFYEKQASQTEPRFRYFRNARELYNGYIQANQIAFDSLTTEQQRTAANAPQLHQAKEGFLQATRLAWEDSYWADTATGLYQLGLLSYLMARPDDAEALFHKALSLYQNLPQTAPTSISNTLYFLGLLALQKGQPEIARGHLEDAMQIDRLHGTPQDVQFSAQALQKCDQYASGGFNSQYWTAPGASIFDENEFINQTIPDNLNEPHDSQPSIDTTAPDTNGSPSMMAETIWIFSNKPAAAIRCMDALEGLAAQTRSKVSLIPAAFSEYAGRAYSPPVLTQNEILCAAVFLLEKDGLENTNTHTWLAWCIQQVILRPDFRLYVVLEDISLAELQEYDKEKRLPSNLLDTVQVMSQNEMSRLADSLVRHILSVNGIRKVIVGRKLRGMILALASRIAGFIQFTCILLVGIATILRTLAGETVFGEWANLIPGEWVALIAGIPFFPLFLIPVYIGLQGFSKMHITLTKNQHLGFWIGLALLLLPATIAIPQLMKVSLDWILLGILVGILIELTRRSGALSRRENLSLEKVFELSTDPHSGRMGSDMLLSPWNFWSYPLFSSAEPDVFISYTRYSDWAREIADRLERALRSHQTRAFRDEVSIPGGSNWRSQLNESLGKTNVFVAVLDEQAMSRQWLAAEMLMAITAQSMTGLPSIYILSKSPFEHLRGKLPIFSAIERQKNSPQSNEKIRFITVDDVTVTAFASGLKNLVYTTPAIFPYRLTLLLLPALLVIQGLGAFGLLPGLLALPLIFLEYREWFSATLLLQTYNLLPAALLLGAYWMGYILRLSFASRFEIDHPNASALANMHLFSGIGFLVAFIHWWGMVSLPIQAWGLALCWLGWVIADGFAPRVKFKNSSAAV